MLSRVIAKNIGDVFMRHSVVRTQRSGITITIIIMLLMPSDP